MQSLAQQIQESHRSSQAHQVIVTNDHLLSFQRHQEGRVTEQEDTQRSDLEGTTANYENIDKTNGYLITGSSVCEE